MEYQTRKCSRCHTVKELSLFGKSAKGKNGFAPHCKDCEKIRKAKYESQSPEKMKSYLKSYYEKTIDCQKENRKKYYIENKEKFIERAKDRYAKIITEKKIYDKEYRIKNKGKIAQYKKGYNVKYVERRATDPLYAMKCRIRKRTSQAFYYMFKKKAHHSHELLGADWETIKIHIENQFTDGMNWNNNKIDGWHIDHIQPLASAKSEEELVALCHYTNLQPLWCLDNLSKGAIFDGVNYKTKQ
jgi:hypothetical protein